MKKNITKILFGLGLFFWLAPQALASTTYIRTPAGTEPTSPVNATFTYDSISDFSVGTQSWYFALRGDNGTPDIVSGCLSTATLTSTLTATNEGDSFWRSIVQEYTDTECQTPQEFPIGTYFNEEGSVGNPVFTVTSSAYFTLGSISDVSTPVADLVTDSWSYLALVIGITLGFYVIFNLVAIFKINRQKDEKIKRWKEEERKEIDEYEAERDRKDNRDTKNNQ